VIVGKLPTYAQLSTASGNRGAPTLLPPHPFAARTPFRTHPSQSKPSEKPEKLTFRSNIELSSDPIITQKLEQKGKLGSENDGDLDDATCRNDFSNMNMFGALLRATRLFQGYEMLNEKSGERLGPAAIAFLADMCRNPPALLPRDIRPDERHVEEYPFCTFTTQLTDQHYPSESSPYLQLSKDSWFPTMSFQLEFKVDLASLPENMIAPHTFGVWSTGRFVHLGRHEVHGFYFQIIGLFRAYAESNVLSLAYVRAHNPHRWFRKSGQLRLRWRMAHRALRPERMW
jgi:hypothetical protein